MNAEDLTEKLKEAISILDDAAVPPDLRAEAFRVVWASLYSPEDSAGIAVVVPATPGETDADDSGWFAFAARLGVEVDMLQEAFDRREDGAFSVEIPTSALPKTKSAATRELALLTCAGRQPEIEEWTAAEEIRRVCQHYGKFDSANHAANLGEGGVYWMISGSGKDRRYKLRKTGVEEAANIVRRIAGD